MTIMDTVIKELSKHTFIFGIPLWIIILTSTCLLTFFALLLCICCCCCNKSSQNPNPNSSNHKNPRIGNSNRNNKQSIVPEIQIDIDKRENRVVVSNGSKLNERTHPTTVIGGGSVDSSKKEVYFDGWGHVYSLSSLWKATNEFSEDNVIAVGAFGVVYRGVLPDNSLVSVKKLLNNRGQVDKDFKVEVEALGRISHKNLVSLVGYCADGDSRMLVYEYVVNGNLHQWLHGESGQANPLTWDIRMKIILGTAKALTYLHECLDPKIIHRDVKSYNILLDQQWNPKVTEFGFAKLLQTDMSHVATRVMGTYGYAAPEYVCTGILNERSDVYSFGVLVMEIVTGRNPVNHFESSEQMGLVDWVKTQISTGNIDQIVDPKLQLPASKEIKRVILVALRCVDSEARQRPKMGKVVHMLESKSFQFGDEYLHTRKVRFT